MRSDHERVVSQFQNRARRRMLQSTLAIILGVEEDLSVKLLLGSGASNTAAGLPRRGPRSALGSVRVHPLPRGGTDFMPTLYFRA